MYRTAELVNLITQSVPSQNPKWKPQENSKPSTGTSQRQAEKRQTARQNRGALHGGWKTFFLGDVRNCCCCSCCCCCRRWRMVDGYPVALVRIAGFINLKRACFSHSLESIFSLHKYKFKYKYNFISISKSLYFFRILAFALVNFHINPLSYNQTLIVSNKNTVPNRETVQQNGLTEISYFSKKLTVPNSSRLHSFTSLLRSVKHLAR